MEISERTRNWSVAGFDTFRRLPVFSLMLAGDVAIGAMALPAWSSLQERRLPFVLRH